MKSIITACISLLALSQGWGAINCGEHVGARHDVSACYSSISDQFSHVHNNAVRIKVANWYQRRLESMVGVYESEQSEGLNYFEWAGCAKLLIYVQDTNHINLIVESRDHLLYQANDCCGGVLTDKTLFFGPSQAGLCFYYETVGDTLFTIFSPFGLQEKIVFRRTNKLINRIPSEVYKPIFERTRMGGSFTNWEYYIDCLTNSEQVRRCELKRMERLESIRGTYVYKNQKERGCKLWSNADEVYLIINNTNDVVLAELVRNKLYFVEVVSSTEQGDYCHVCWGWKDIVGYVAEYTAISILPLENQAPHSIYVMPAGFSCYALVIGNGWFAVNSRVTPTPIRTPSITPMHIYDLATCKNMMTVNEPFNGRWFIADKGAKIICETGF